MKRLICINKISFPIIIPLNVKDAVIIAIFSKSHYNIFVSCVSIAITSLLVLILIIFIAFQDTSNHKDFSSTPPLHCFDTGDSKRMYSGVLPSC